MPPYADNLKAIVPLLDAEELLLHSLQRMKGVAKNIQFGKVTPLRMQVSKLQDKLRPGVPTSAYRRSSLMGAHAFSNPGQGQKSI